MAYSARKLKFCVDGNSVAHLRNGDAVTVQVQNGPHIISFQFGNKTVASASISDSTEGIFIVCWASNSGGVEFYSSNKNITKQFDSSGKNKQLRVFSVLLLIVTVLTLFFLLHPGFVLFVTV